MARLHKSDAWYPWNKKSKRKQGPLSGYRWAGNTVEIEPGWLAGTAMDSEGRHHCFAAARLDED